MREILDLTWHGNTTGEWGISLSVILGAILVSRLLHWFFKTQIRKLTARTKSNLDDLIIDTVEEPVLMGVVVVGIYWGLERLHMSEAAQLWVNRLYHVLIVINVTWFFARFADALIRQYLAPLAERSDNSLDDHIVPIIRRGVKLGIWIMGIVVAMDNAGYDVGAVLAGLGIGGVAMALAAKDFVANIFGGITVYADKPFKVGDRIQVGGYDGNVTDIGLRSTKIRTAAGRMVTIPNFKFTDSFVENISVEPTRRIEIGLGLVHDTSAAKMERAVDVLGEIVKNKANVLDAEYYASFSKWNEASLGITFIYFIKSGNNFWKVQDEVNREILSRFNSEGLIFASGPHKV